MDIILQLSLVLGSIIIGFLLAAFILWYRTRRFIDRAHKATGVVIKVRKVPFENRDTFSPVVRFTTSDGRALSFTDPVSCYPSEFEVGERAEVLYDPHNPHRARAVKKVSDLFLEARLFWVASAALLAVGFLIGAAYGLMNYFPEAF